ncbi:MAG TPA: SUF system NifU family Fe-S cluster assembly protein [Roseiflexaceae bacterium]|jgi:nitrogen fixation NifU-like protein|nr:SUF system NifU family Fe-S cluster assembly protein [Roseiflexaceae bacterium]
MDDMYRELILEHNKHPHNVGTLDHPDVSHEETNPLCGDRIKIDLAIESGIITDVRFVGRGCAISQASASLLTDELKGKSLDEVRALTNDDMLDLIGIPLDKNPVRIKCALLPLKTLKYGIYQYLGEHVEDDDF